MKDIEQKEKFIELRAKGFSFDKISEEINVSKPILIKWSSEFGKQIYNLKFLCIDELIEKHNLMREKRIEIYLEMLNNLINEVKNRDLKNINTRDLVKMVINLDEKINNDLDSIKYLTGEFDSLDWGLDEQEKKIALLY